MRSAVGGLRWGSWAAQSGSVFASFPHEPPRRDPTAYKCKDRVDPSPDYPLANGAAERTPIPNLSVWPAHVVDRSSDAAVPRTSASPRRCHPSLGVAEG